MGCEVISALPFSLSSSLPILFPDFPPPRMFSSLCLCHHLYVHSTINERVPLGFLGQLMVLDLEVFLLGTFPKSLTFCCRIRPKDSSKGPRSCGSISDVGKRS